MKKNDELKGWITENRSDFDKMVPSPQVWREISARLPEPKPRFTFMVWRIAAAILLFTALGVYGAIWIAQNAQQPQQVETAQSGSKPAKRERSQSVQVWEDVSKDIVRISDERTPQSPKESERAITTQPALLTESLPPSPHEVPASKRIEEVLALSDLHELPESKIELLLQTVKHDPNSNVRLAALELLASRLPEERSNQIIQEVFVEQDDPFLQLELMIAMASDDSLRISQPVAERLYAITEDPRSLDFVKEHALAVLMMTW